MDWPQRTCNRYNLVRSDLAHLMRIQLQKESNQQESNQQHTYHIHPACILH